MEEVEQGVSTFPDPPKLFYKLYTDENVQSGLAPPPPPVISGSYSTFGSPFDVSRTTACEIFVLYFLDKRPNFKKP